MEEMQPTPEIEGNNVRRGFRLAKTISREHEKELRAILDNGEITSYTDPISSQSISKESLKAEFEERALSEGIDLQNFYEEAPRQSLTGHRFELLGIIQIIC